MPLNHPLKKKYDRKCIPVRRVSAWEREQIEKRQRHLKEFKGEKWQKLHREDQLRKIKAKAAGIKYVRLSSVRSVSLAPKKVSRAPARRTRVVRLPSKKKNPHKRQGHSTRQPRTFAINNNAACTTYRPPPKKYRFRREPPPPTPLTTQNLKQFRMTEKMARRGLDYHYGASEKKVAQNAMAQLHQIISEYGDSAIIRRQVRYIKKLRENAPSQPINLSLNHAEKILFQLITDRGSQYDIRLQSEKVQSLSTVPAPAQAVASPDADERTKPVKPKHGREATWPPPAPVPTGKDAHEGTKPAKRELGRARKSAAPSARPLQAGEDSRARARPPEPERGRKATGPPAPVPAGNDANKGIEPAEPERGHARELSASSLGLIRPREDSRTRGEPSKADNGSRQEVKRAGASLDASTRHKHSPCSIGEMPLFLPPRNSGQTGPAFIPQGDGKKENKRAESPFDASAQHKAPSEYQESLFVDDSPSPHSPFRHGREPALAPKPDRIQKQDGKQPRAPLDATTRNKQPPKSQTSASSIGDPLDAPPPHRVRKPIPFPGPSQPRGKQTERPRTAPASSLGDLSDTPFPPHRPKQTTPLTRPPQLCRKETARPRTAPNSSNHTNKRPQSSASVSSRTSSFAIPPSATRGRQLSGTVTPPPPPKRRRARTQRGPDLRLPSESPSPPPPRAPVLPPPPRFKALTSITDKEDKASRALMHPASAPLAKLPDPAKVQTEDFEKVGRIQRAHPSFVKARGNVNLKHVRHVNRGGGRGREVKEPERSVWERVGMMRGGEGLVGAGGGLGVVAQVGLQQRTEVLVQTGRVGQAQGGQTQSGQAEERGAGQAQVGQVELGRTGQERGKPGSRRSSVGTETGTTIADLIAAEFGPGEGEDDEL